MLKFRHYPTSGSSQIIFDPNDEVIKSGDRLSTPSSMISRSDRTPSKFKQSIQNNPNQDQKKGSNTKPKTSQGTGASFSGLTFEERARSLQLPTMDETEGSVPRER